jgi:hypothetical protein
MKIFLRAALVAALFPAIMAGELALPAMAQTHRGNARSPSQSNPWNFGTWPILAYDPQGVFLYATQGATNIGISPYQNNLAIGFETLNPTTHNSANCNVATGLDGFCGDEVAFGDNTLQFDVTGRDNTAIGDHALANVISAEGDTAVGSSAAANIHTSGAVDAFGVAACQNARDYAGPITCIGQASMEFAGSSSRNTTAVGYQAALNTTEAQFSTIVGVAAGFSAKTDNFSVLVGEDACHIAISINNVICIGTINGPAGGSMSDTLWIGGNNGSTPILYGNLARNAVVIGGTIPAAGAGLTVKTGGIVGPFVRTTPATVSGLSAADPAPQFGDRALVTDAMTCTFGSGVTGGGATKCPVYYDGTSWIAG